MAQEYNVSVLCWPSQSPDLRSIENLWANMKRYERARRHTTIAQLQQFCQDEWAKIPADYCENERFIKCLTQVIQFNNNCTKN